MSPMARIRADTPSSQAKKSSFEVRSGICATLGKGFERMESGVCYGKGEEDDEEETGCSEYKGGTYVGGRGREGME